MKKYIKYLLVFIFSLIILLFPYNMFFGDSIANLGFSYGIIRGEIPYNDFNIIIPLLSPLLYAIPLFLYNSAITFYITQALLLTILFNLVEKKINSKIYLLLFIILFNFPISLIAGLFPGYNFILFLLILILSYLDNNQTNDYLIGLIIGLSILTKHTIGIFLIIPSLIFYFKDYKKILKRLIGLLIPCIIFLIYLIITKSLHNFINLCILGIFDFASNNRISPSPILLGLLIISMGYFIYIIKNKREISSYYLFLTILFVYPLFDDYHASYFIIATLIVLLENINISKVIIVPNIILDFFLIIIWTYIAFNYRDNKFINYNHYPFRYMSKEMINNYNYIDRFFDSNDKNVILFMLVTENYFYKITNDLNITYYDLTNYGNYGYNSFNMMKEKINSEKDSYFIINKKALDSKNSKQQYYKELVKYIVEKGKFIESNNNYNIYYLE